MAIMLMELMLMAVFLLQAIHSMTDLVAAIPMEMDGQTQAHRTLLKTVLMLSLQMRLSGLTAMVMAMVMNRLEMTMMIVQISLEHQLLTD